MAQAEYHGQVVTLQVEEGKVPGKPIAWYRTGRRTGYAVFLPDNAPIGQNVRVKLADTGNKDRADNPMYRGIPEVEYTNRWKDNGDGTAAKVTIASDWLLQESEEGVVETRPLETREHPDRAEIHTDRVVVWGSDLASSQVLEEQVTTIPTFYEFVNPAGSISTQQVSTREERSAPQILPVTEVTWQLLFPTDGKFDVVYDADWNMSVRSSFSGGRVDEVAKWGVIPAWLQQEVQATLPVCPCSRKRRDPQVADGYGKCEFCRLDEVCVRCGNKALAIKNLAGRMTCSACEPYEAAEQLIETSLPSECRQAIAAEAKKLLAGQALEGALGYEVLKATLTHVSDDYRREQIINRWKDYQYYYFTDQGVFGTKFAPGALQVLENLPQASGNGLVELACWLTGPAQCRADNNSDYYTASQVMGGNARPITDAINILNNWLRRIEVANHLRGSEAKRIEAISEYHRLVERLGEESDEAKAVAAILQSDAQDYAAALAKIREAEDLLGAAERGEVLVNFGGHFRHMGQNDQCDCWVIAPDGSEVEAQIDYRKRYISEGNKTWKIVAPECLALRWSRGQGGRQYFESWEVVKLPANRLTRPQVETARSLEPHERFRGEGTGFDLSRIGTVSVSVSRDEYEIPTRSFSGSDGTQKIEPIRCEVNGWVDSGEDGWSSPDPTTLTVRAKEAEVRNLQGELMSLDYEREQAGKDCAEAESSWLAREEGEAETSPVENGTVFLVPAFRKETFQGQDSWACGPLYDWPSGTFIKLVLDPFCNASCRIDDTSHDVLVKVRPKNSSQLHLFQAFIRPAGGGSKQQTFGYFVVPILSSKEFDTEIKALEGKLQAAKSELEGLKAASTEPPKNKPPKKQKERESEPESSTWYDDSGSSALNPMADALKRPLGEN